MDVQCERCKTEYEFDDALVSGRGTTVKCTNCGFQFKLRPVGDANAVLERWTIRTVAGAELVFTTLRELQRAIADRRVGRGDTLRRGNAPPRRLGDIAELEPFFPSPDPPRPESDRLVAVPAGGAQTVRGLARLTSAEDLAQNIASGSDGEESADLPPARERLVTLRPASEDLAAAPAPASARLVPTTSAPPPEDSRTFSEAGTIVAPAAHLDFAAASQVAAWMAPPTVEVAPPVPTQPLRHGDPSYEDIEANDSVAPDPLYSMVPQRRRVGGWIVALVLLIGVSIIGYNVARPYLSSDAKSSGAASALDPRAAQFLADGEHALADGNLDLATESFAKASVLAQRDAHVRLDIAHVTAVRTDIPWLRLRLLPEGAGDDVRATQQQLSDMMPVLGKASTDALSSAPDDPAANREKVDALRLLGERDAARALVARIGSASMPETSYVLAALDLAEVGPLWTTVVDRLRIAAAGEGNLGRARAALVYALARAGDAAGAKAELDRLASFERPHPLVAPLRAFLARSSMKTTSDAGATTATAHTLGTPATPPVRPAAGETTDPRALLQQAAEAENRGQLPRAAKLYEEALRSDPRSSEALSGVGSVALKQGDYATASLHFGKALAINPNYVPAIVGQADALWAEGDRNAAIAKYKDLVDRFPESSGFPSYVKTRAAGSASGAAPVTAKPEPQDTGKVPASSSARPAEFTLPSNVPSDLPGSAP